MSIEQYEPVIREPASWFRNRQAPGVSRRLRTQQHVGRGAHDVMAGGAAQAAATAAAGFAGSPDLQPTIEEFVAAGDEVAERGTARGPHSGGFARHAPTGAAVAPSRARAHRVDWGIFPECRAIASRLATLQQIGAVGRVS